MSALGLAALAVLAAVAAALVVIAALHLGRERRGPPDRTAPPARPKWFELLMAVGLLALLIALAVTVALDLTPASGAGGDWRGDIRSRVFLGIMLAGAALALLFLVVFLVGRLSRRDESGAAADAETAPGAATVESPAASRLIGLLLLALGLLVLGWSYLEPSGEAALVLRALYPASIAVAVVLLFDKATRAWTPKTPAEGVREWLLCDLAVLALVLGFVNLEHFESPESYRAFFWDLVHIVAFFLVFWLLDRTQIRGRFLVATAYLALLPLLLLLWRWRHEIEAPAEISWWSTVWPIFFLGLAFSVLEVIALIALRGRRGHPLLAIKDGLFVALYAAFLLAAVPDGG